VGLEVGGEVIPAEAGIWIPRRRRAGGGFRNGGIGYPAGLIELRIFEHL